MSRTIRFMAAWAVVAVGCSGDPETQVITGRVSASDAIAVRAVSDGTVVTAGRVRSNGAFTLLLPAGARYRLEVLTASGVLNVVGAKDAQLSDIVFKVCAPTDPFDMGGLGTPMDPGNTNGGCPDNTMPGPDGTCGDKPTCTDPMDPSCVPPCDPSDPSCAPSPCDPTDPNCVPPCDPMSDPSCEPPPPDCQPGDPNCPTCDPTNGTNCEPPPCDPATDPMCKPLPPPGCENGVLTPDGECVTCDPMVEVNCPIPPPPCMDPTDPNTCKDPCLDDPALCGCANGGTVDEMTCWPPPEPCDLTTMLCDPGDGLTPQNPPIDFGCKD